MDEEWDEWNDEDERAEELKTQEALNLLCQKIDRIIAGSTAIDVLSGPDVPAPGATSGNRIFINHTFIENKLLSEDANLLERLTMTLCVNAHELGHRLFSQGYESEVWAKRRKELWENWNVTPSTGTYPPDVDKALNMLEDQREELFMALRFPKTKDYFRMVALKFLRDQAHAGTLRAEAYALWYGRRHILPIPLIARLRQACANTYGEGETLRIEEIINEYCSLGNTEGDHSRMWELAIELVKIIGDFDQPNCMPQGKTSAKVRNQEEISKEAGEALGKVDEAIEKKKDEAKSEEQKNDEKAPSAGTSADKDEKKDEKKSTPPSQAKRERITEKEIEDVLDAAEDAAWDKIEEDVLDKMESLRGAGIGTDFGDASKTVHLDEQYITRARTIAKMFKDIVVDLNMEEKRFQRKGKLDVRRLSTCLQAQSNRMFKHRQRDLTHETAMAVHIMFDVSGSMGSVDHGPMKQMVRDATGNWVEGQHPGSPAHIAMTTSYTLAKAAELAGHKVKISAFADVTKTVKDWNARKYGGTVPGCGGGTDPSKGILDAKKDFDAICHAENINHKVLIIVTDGEFGNMETANTNLKRLIEREGVHVYIIGIGAEIGYKTVPENEYRSVNGSYKLVKNPNAGEKIKNPNAPTAEEIVDIKTAVELPTVLKKLLKRLNKNVAADVKRRMA